MRYLELKSRKQQQGETLQNYAADIERLAQEAYSQFPAEVVDMQKIQAFVDGIKDLDTKRAVMVSPKSSFAETVGFAFTQETATLACTSQWKVKRAEINDDSLEEMVCQAVKVALRSENSTIKKRGLNCFFCEKPGHFLRDCRLRQKWLQEKQLVASRRDTGYSKPCSFCEKYGHSSLECGRRQQWLQQHKVENVSVEEEDSHLN